MGDCLCRAIKKKQCTNGNCKAFRYGTCAMQGWRRGMEDAHITDLNVANTEIHVLGVFDGHTGIAVAEFCKRKFTEELTKNDNFKKGNFEKAMYQTYLKMDEMLREEKHQPELREIATRSRYFKELIRENDIKGGFEYGFDMNKKDYLFNYNNNFNNNFNKYNNYGNNNNNSNNSNSNNKFDSTEDEFKEEDQKIEDQELYLKLKQEYEEMYIAMGTGATATVCLIHEKKAYFANAGDSRAVISKSGIAYAMTLDHKPDMEMERRRVERAGGYVNKGRIDGKCWVN
jgi:protein phosphatase 1G